ncbi:hypothetical protein OESDEN_15274 [Oesophagostomum dentatum]|uniref:Uncharacterized protein n=1 Tax=Oesophagostomum dentatum TaxID=61180 RepID=A0A0B1SP70_OESDE|nr:hypothetical protein OESDEN_15274 [Oesophagostomum dentatum]
MSSAKFGSKKRTSTPANLPTTSTTVLLDSSNEQQMLTVIKLLDALDILETRPVEINRMGMYRYDALKKAPLLRQNPTYGSVRIRRSMTVEERNGDKELRREAHELNEKKGNGEKIYVVYRGQIVKACDIPTIQATVSKNVQAP